MNLRNLCLLGLLKDVESLCLFLLQTRLWTIWAGEDAGYSVSDTECENEIEKLKQEMTKVYNYSQGFDISLASHTLHKKEGSGCVDLMIWSMRNVCS